MFKRPITYTDYNGKTVTEDHYFNLSRAELMELELTTPGGWVESIERMTEAEDPTELFKTFKDLILRSYGTKSPDGKRFIKSEEIRTAFEQTEAYSQLFMELLQSPEVAAEFLKQLIPKNYAVPTSHVNNTQPV